MRDRHRAVAVAPLRARVVAGRVPRAPKTDPNPSRPDDSHPFARRARGPPRRPRESRSRADSRDKDQDSELGIYVADEDDESRYEGKSNDAYDDGAYGARRDAKSDLDYDAKGD